MHPAGHDPGPDHDPIDPPSRWWKEVSDGHSADILEARRKGQEPWIDDRIPPYPSYPDMQRANPPRRPPEPLPALPPGGEG